MSLENASRPQRKVDVMVAEDDPRQCDELRDFLKLARVSFHIVHDGRSALQALDEVEPRILILDIRMSGMDGIAVAREVSKRENPPVTILVSGHMDSVVEANQSETRPFRVIEKPINLRTMARFIDAVLQRPPGAG